MELIGLLHEVRARFLKAHHMSELEIKGCAFLMRQLIIDYLNEAYWGNELKITMTIKAEKARIIFDYTVQNLSQNTLTATAKATMVLINKTTKKITKSDFFFEQLNTFS